jgi:hypothetical protein
VSIYKKLVALERRKLHLSSLTFPERFHSVASSQHEVFFHRCYSGIDRRVCVRPRSGICSVWRLRLVGFDELCLWIYLHKDKRLLQPMPAWWQQSNHNDPSFYDNHFADWRQQSHWRLWFWSRLECWCQCK